MAETTSEAKVTSPARIHINRKPYESPNPTNGEALYVLGKIEPGQELFREERGDKEDEPVRRGPEVVVLREDEHFYSVKDYRIIVNAREKIVTSKELSFDEVAKLAFPTPPPGQNIMYTITYRHGPKKNREGTMVGLHFGSGPSQLGEHLPA